MNAREAVREAAPRLESAGVDDAGFEAELLARDAAGISRASYFAGHDLRAGELKRFHELVARRVQREPAAHILGAREFYGLQFEVTPDALVPRPETELLVDIALAAFAALTPRPPLPTSRERGSAVTPGRIVPGQSSVVSPQCSVLDVGTGTGCIAVSIAHHQPSARVIATDVSPAALAVARRNAARHRADVRFTIGDLATPIARADVVVANLPYIPTDEVRALQPEVRDYEPLVALDGGVDGLVLIRRLIDDCAARLRPKLLAIEVGYGQAGAVASYASDRGAAVELVKDLAGIDRVVCARWA